MKGFIEVKGINDWKYLININQIIMIEQCPDLCLIKTELNCSLKTNCKYENLIQMIEEAQN